MKRHITIIIAAAALLLMKASAAQGQTFFGLEAGACYPPEEVETAMNEKASDVEVNGRDWKRGYTATFSGVVIRAFENGEFYSFEVTDRKHRLFTDAIDGGLRVGDDISRVFHLKNGYPKADDDGTGNEGCYRIFTKQEDSYNVWYNRKTGKITSIDWCIAR